MNDSAIIQALTTLYHAPLEDIAKLHPEEIEEDLAAFDDEAVRLGAPTLPFTAGAANAAIAREIGRAS